MKRMCNSLENELKNLKLEKRSFLLNGKDTRELDRKIKDLQLQLDNNQIESQTV